MQICSEASCAIVCYCGGLSVCLTVCGWVGGWVGALVSNGWVCVCVCVCLFVFARTCGRVRVCLCV